MKTAMFLIVLCSLFYVAHFEKRDVSPEQKKQFEKCKAEIGLTDADLENERSSKKPSDKLNCFMDCMLKSNGILSSNGSLNKTRVFELKPSNMSNQDAQEAVNSCQYRTGDSDCVTAGLLIECFKMYMLMPFNSWKQT